MSTTAVGPVRRCGSDRLGAAAAARIIGRCAWRPAATSRSATPSGPGYRPCATSGPAPAADLAREFRRTARNRPCHPWAESIAPQRLCVSRRNGVAVDVQQRGRCGVVEAPLRRAAAVTASPAPTRRRATADRRSAHRRSPAYLRPASASRPYGPAVPSIRPAPLFTGDGILEMACVPTPVNNERASSPRSSPHAGLPWASTRSPVRAVVTSSGGRDRLSPRKNPSTPSTCSVNGPNRRRHEAPSSSSAHVRSSEWYATAAGRSGSGLTYETSGATSCTPRAARSNSAKNGETTPSGCTAEQMSWRTPG